MPLLQAYYDLAKLLRKGSVVSGTTTWVIPVELYERPPLPAREEGFGPVHDAEEERREERRGHDRKQSGWIHGFLANWYARSAIRVMAM